MKILFIDSVDAKRLRLRSVVAALLCLCVVISSFLLSSAPALADGPTTSLIVTKYDPYGNILSTQTVTWEWMRDNLPVYGDGKAHYYFQGPTFDDSSYDLLWDPGEMVNIDSRDYGASQGTDVADLCNLVGGAQSGDTIQVKAADNFSKWFDYEDAYNPEPEQGKMIVTWYTQGSVEDPEGGYVPAYGTGMRLIFFAATPNPEGKWVFGLWDMHQYLPPSRWHYYYDGKYWPSSSGLSVKNVSKINIYQPKLVSCDAAGNLKDDFAAGETVYVKGLGLSANTGYKLWIQSEPVLEKPLNALERPEGAFVFNAANDLSGAQEPVTTDASGDFSPTPIWNTDPSAEIQKYDIVADNQLSGTVGTFDSSDGIDNPGRQGFEITSHVETNNNDAEKGNTEAEVIKATDSPVTAASMTPGDNSNLGTPSAGHPDKENAGTPVITIADKADVVDQSDAAGRESINETSADDNGSSNTGLWIGIIAGVIVLLGAVVAWRLVAGRKRPETR